jgi:hypothetical protein
LEDLEEGIYYYNVTIFDIVNYSNSTETRRIGLDLFGPVVSIVDPKSKTLDIIKAFL